MRRHLLACPSLSDRQEVTLARWIWLKSCFSWNHFTSSENTHFSGTWTVQPEITATISESLSEKSFKLLMLRFNISLQGNILRQHPRPSFHLLTLVGRENHRCQARVSRRLESNCPSCWKLCKMFSPLPGLRSSSHPSTINSWAGALLERPRIASFN